MNAVVAGFDQSDRGQLIMACGTGKTLTALFITEKLAAQRTLVLVPSLSLLAQTLREWTANTKVGFDYLPVCSDETVAEPDAVVANTSDLGFPVTTDPEQIARSCAGGPARGWCSPPTSPRRRSPRRSGWAGCPPSTWSSPTRRIAAPGASPPTSPPSSTARRSGRAGGCS